MVIIKFRNLQFEMKSQIQQLHVSQGRSTPCIGDKLIQPLIGNPYNGYINPYYWVDDHPLLYGNNVSLDASTCSNNYIPDSQCLVYLPTRLVSLGGLM